MRGLRLTLLLLIASMVAITILYFDDPWLWRRFANTFIYMAAEQPDILNPNEPVAGDGSFEIETATPDQRSVSDLALKAVEDYAARFDSFALIVVHKGKIQTEWYAEGYDRSRQLQSQSMHKSLLAILIGAAISDGQIDSADDPVAKYIPEWQDDPRGDITLRELMMMSSGLGQYEFSLNPFVDDFRWLYSSDTQPVVLRTPMANWDPGTKFDYNNINSELLGTVIENATGQRYAEHLENRLWRPLGAQSARVWVDREFGNAFTSCCLMASAMDWTRIGLMLLNDGKANGTQIIPAEWVRTMTARSPVSDWYGLQVWLGYETEPTPYGQKPATNGAYDRSEPFLAPDLFYFSGRGAQRVYVVPSLDLVIVRIGPALGRRPLKPGWDNAFLVNSIIRGMR